MVTAERGIYRPGETVHLLGILRRRLGNGRLVPPVGQAVVTVKNPKGEVMSQSSAAITGFGTVRQSVALSGQTDIGRYQVALRHGEHEVVSSFEVGAYRSASFEVSLPATDALTTDDDTLYAPVKAAYLYGAPVAGQPAAWSVSWRPRRMRAAGMESFRFLTEDDENAQWQHITEGETKLDADGEVTLEIPKSALPEKDSAPAIDLLLEVTVTDAADDEITARAVVPHQLAETLVGVESKQWVVSPKEGWTVEVVALEGGVAVAGKEIEIDLHRSFWRTAAEKGPHGVRYRQSRERELVTQRTVTSGAEPVSVQFEIAGGGEYELSVRQKGGGYATHRSMWAYGEEATAPVENTPRMALHLDKTSYEPGDVARVHAANPYGSATALVTVERAGIMHSRVMALDGATQPIEMAVTGEHVPNAYVSVAVVPRSEKNGTPAAGNPFRAGYAEIAVSAASRRLAVEVLPTETELRPAGEAVVKVRVRDHANVPVGAEVTVWAADEGC